ncbi:MULTISPECIES: YcxB family protein [unclassified Streptomyces]
MDTTDQAVGLYYGTARSDVRQVQRWCLRERPRDRRGLPSRLLSVPVLVVALVWLTNGGRVPEPAVTVAAGLVMGLLWCLTDLALRCRRWYAWAAEYPEYHCVVSESGMSNYRPDGTVVDHGWARYSGWSETRHLFVVVFTTGDVGWLPKRAATTAQDIDRIRSIFDRNLTRVGRVGRFGRAG